MTLQENRSQAYERGWDAGYDTRNYATNYGIETVMSYDRYREQDGSRTDYSEGWSDGVDSYDQDYEISAFPTSLECQETSRELDYDVDEFYASIAAQEKGE